MSRKRRVRCAVSELKKMDVSDDADTGKTLWQFETRSGINAKPIRSRTTDSNTLNSEKSRLEPSLYTRS